MIFFQNVAVTSKLREIEPQTSIRTWLHAVSILPYFPASATFCNLLQPS